jgi:hypothetical protein
MSSDRRDSWGRRRKVVAYISSARLTPRRPCLGYETDSKRMGDLPVAKGFAFLAALARQIHRIFTTLKGKV